jgi:hypothetical protein
MMPGQELETVEDQESEESAESEKEAVDDIEDIQIEPTGDELGGDLFDSVDEADESGGDDADSESGDGEESMGPATVGDSALGDTINDGAARLAVVGLSEGDFDGDGSPDALEDELREVFEAFRLGHFGSQAAEKHILSPGDSEIDPVWGLLGSLLLAGAITLMMRPDGSEKMGEFRETVENLTGGLEL